MAEPVHQLLVDWEGDGLFDHAESDVWKNAISISTSVGRDYGSQLIGRSIAGQLTVQLHDDTGLYSRFNSNSSLFGLALPTRKVRFNVGLDTARVRARLTAASELWPVGGTVQTGGDLILESGLNVDRLIWNIVNDRFSMYRKSGDTVTMSTFWGGTGTGAGLSVYIENASGTIVEIPYWALHQTESEFASWNLFDANRYSGVRTVLDGINSGQQFWLYVDRPYIKDYDGAIGYSSCWGGFLDSIRPQPQRGGFAIVELRALGIISRLADAILTGIGSHTNINPREAINVVLDAALIPEGDRDINNGVATIPRWWSPRQSALEALREIEHTEPGFIRELSDGRIRFENRNHRAQGLGRISRATFADTTGTGYLPYRNITAQDPIKDVANEVRIPIRKYTVENEAVLWQSEDVPRRIRTGKEDRDGATPNIDGVAIEWTTNVVNGVHHLIATTDYLGNSQADGNGTDLTSSLVVTAELNTTTPPQPGLYDTSMDIRIQNTGTQDVWLRKLQARGKVVQDDGESTVPDYDIDSINDYGKRLYRFPASFMTDREDARDFATVLLAQTKDAHPKISMTINANLSDEVLVNVISREVSDRVTVIGMGPSHLGLNQDMYIETIQHDITAPGIHRTRYVLSSGLATGVEKVIVLAPSLPAFQKGYGPGLGTGILAR